MTGPYEDEIELAPGIYLTKRKQPSQSTAQSKPAPSSTPTRPSVSATLLSSSPADTAAHLQEEISRLRRSVELLLRSNQELKEADPNGEDHVFVEVLTSSWHAIVTNSGNSRVLTSLLLPRHYTQMQAITENTSVIARQLVQIRRHEEELVTLSQPSTKGGGRGCSSQAANLGVGVALAAGAGGSASSSTARPGTEAASAGPSSPTSTTTLSSLLSPPSVASPPLSGQNGTAGPADQMIIDGDVSGAEGIYL